MSSDSRTLMLLGWVILTLIAVAVAIYVRVPLKVTWRGVLISMLPSSLMLALFYSLAVRLYQHLGKWPESIGDAGFPHSLIIHESISINYFVILLLLNLFVWPIVLLLCAIIRSGRGLVSYLGIHILSYFVSWGLMLLAPSGFLNWWWD